MRLFKCEIKLKEEKRETQEHLFDFSKTQNIFQKLCHVFYFNMQPLFYSKWEKNIYLSFKTVF